MEIRLDCGEWFFNGYRINGNYEDGYDVYYEDGCDDYDEELDTVLYHSKDFEECLTWCYNS